MQNCFIQSGEGKETLERMNRTNKPDIIRINAGTNLGANSSVTKAAEIPQLYLMKRKELHHPSNRTLHQKSSTQKQIRQP